MHGTASEQPWALATIRVPGCGQFRIAYGTDATAETDPLAVAYREGSLAHLDTLITVARTTLERGNRVLDLGAHLGGFALAAATLGCEVLAVEASPRNAALLERSIAENQFQKVHVVQAAVSDKSGSVEFTPHGPWGHVATPASGIPTVVVPAVMVDDLLQQQGWDSVRFVKLDVEGSEVRAIKGMQRLLQRGDAPMIFFESNQFTLGLYGESDESLRAELRKLGYTLYEVGPGRLGRVPEGYKQPALVVDYVAAKQLHPRLEPWASNSLLQRLGRFLDRFGRRR